MKCKALIGAGQYDDAYSYVTTLMRSSGSNDRDLLFWRAKALYYQGSFEKAIQVSGLMFVLCLVVAAVVVVVVVGCGFVLLTFALQHLQQTLRLDPDYAAARNDIKMVRKLERMKAEGNAAFSSGQLQEAIDKYTECLEVDPNNKPFCSKLLNNRATAKARLRQYEEALSDCDAAIQMDEGYTKAYMRRADCLKHLAEQAEEQHDQVCVDSLLLLLLLCCSSSIYVCLLPG